MPRTPASARPLRSDGGWILGLVAVVVAGLALRLAYVLVVLDDVPPGLDAIWYTLQGGSLRNGTGYVVPTSLFTAHPMPTAAFPPVYPAYQAGWQWAFGGGPTSVRLAGLVPGAATITLAGLLGRRLVGRRAGLLAAVVVALDPTLISVDGSTMSENVTVPLVVGAVLVAHRIACRGITVRRTALLGLVCGVAALSRQDLLLLLPLLALPALAWSPDADRVRRVAAGAAVVVLVSLVVVPWAWRNHQQVGVFTVSTLSPSSAVAGSNCDRTYGGPSLGSWEFDCVAAVTVPPDATEAEVADAQRTAATSYARHHIGRLPLVAAARQARVWSWWDPRDLARRDAVESRRYGWQLVARPVDAAMAVAGAIGLVLIVRTGGRRARLAVVPLLLVAVSATLVHGNPRFNAIAHPALAVGIAMLATRIREMSGYLVGVSDSRRKLPLSS